MKKEIEQGNNEVVLHQDVARLRGRLTSTQSRSMLAILKRANEQASQNPNTKVFSIPTEVFLDDIQEKNTAGLPTIVKKVSRHLKDLMTQIFEWGTATNKFQTVFMQQIQVTPDEVSFIFSDYIREHIKPVVNVMIVDDFELIQSFRSEYARQLYKHIMMWKKKEHLYLSLEDFKDFLGIPTTPSYQRMDVIKRKVLNVAIKEINEKRTDLNLIYYNRTKKRSKKIIGFDFYWTWIKPLKIEDNQDNQLSLIQQTEQTEQELIKPYIGHKIYVNGELFFIENIVKNKDVNSEYFNKYILLAKNDKKKVRMQLRSMEIINVLEIIKEMMNANRTKP